MVPCAGLAVVCCPLMETSGFPLIDVPSAGMIAVR
jgi:hypothetical protein